jgi:hypothetical protein
MERNSANPDKKKSAATREERLKAALKANLRRRKAQARARQDNDPKEG